MAVVVPAGEQDSLCVATKPTAETDDILRVVRRRYGTANLPLKPAARYLKDLGDSFARSDHARVRIADPSPDDESVMRRKSY
jgi:hypothetical protein